QKRLAGRGVRLLGRVKAIAETSASHPRRSNDSVDDRRCEHRRQKQERSGSQLYHYRDASLRKTRRSLAHGFSPRIPGARISRATRGTEWVGICGFGNWGVERADSIFTGVL